MAINGVGTTEASYPNNSVGMPDYGNQQVQPNSPAINNSQDSGRQSGGHGASGAQDFLDRIMQMAQSILTALPLIGPFLRSLMPNSGSSGSGQGIG